MSRRYSKRAIGPGVALIAVGVLFATVPAASQPAGGRGGRAKRVARGQASDEAKPGATDPLIAISQNITVKVADRDEAIAALVERATKAGGYFTSRTDQELVLKIPAESVKPLVAHVETLGTVIGREYNARDVGRFLAEQRTLLASRKQVLQRYFAVLSTAGPRSVVSVEREMTQLVQEIESLEGSIRLVRHQLAFAELRVSFQFRDRRPPVRDGSSSFAWLNTVNLVDLQQEFAYDSF